MDLFLPIGIGFLSNMAVFLISLRIIKNKQKATNITLLFFGMTLITSFIIGGWTGMGLGVLSLGMLIFSIVSYSYQFIEQKMAK